MMSTIQRVHHDGSALYVSDASPQLGDAVAVRLRAPKQLQPARVFLRTVADGEPRIIAAAITASDATDYWWTAELPIRNPLTHYRWLLEGGDVGYAWLNATGIHHHDIPDAHDFAIAAFAPTPDWAHYGVVYQVFPDRFAKAEERPLPEWAVPASWDDPVVHEGPATPLQLYGGDLAGIIVCITSLRSGNHPEIVARSLRKAVRPRAIGEGMPARRTRPVAPDSEVSDSTRAVLTRSERSNRRKGGLGRVFS